MEVKYWELQDAETGEKRQVKIGACTSVPRLAFTAHWGQMQQAFANLDIPVIKTTGYSWGACLQRAMNQLIEVGCDWIITIDYDSIFSQDDVLRLLTLAASHDEADAIFPWQIKRGGVDRLLFFLRDENDRPLDFAPANIFQGELVRAHGGHFGLTLIKADALKKTPKPWLWEQPNADGEWVEGKEDADIYFWRKFREAGNGIYLANDIRIGHIDEEILWPGEDFKTVRQGMFHFYRDGKPELGPKPVKLNLGAGAAPIEGYENIDLKNGRSAFPLNHADGTVDEVRASHILEHFPRGEVEKVVREWARVLKPGGTMKIAVPDFDWIVKAYSNGYRHNPMIEGYLFGGQADSNDYHKVFFNEEKLRGILAGAGLVDVKRWEADVTDCSALAVSLNLQGRKPETATPELPTRGYTVKRRKQDTRFIPFIHSMTRWNHTSQHGEDSVIHSIFERIGTENKWCLECGASDGLFFSNTRKLIEDGWNSIQVEPDPVFFEQLSERYKDNPRVQCVRQFVGLKPGERLDDVLERCGAPQDIDLLVIDVDGQDYHLWNSLTNYRPRVLVVEYNPAAEGMYIPEPGAEGTQAGLEPLQWMASAKGYTPIMATYCNLICVPNELAHLLEETNHADEEHREAESEQQSENWVQADGPDSGAGRFGAEA